MKKKFLGIICLLYSLIILFVNHYNILRNFLAPSMQIYLKASVPIFIVMAIVIFYSDKFNYKFKLLDLVLLFPLVMLIFAGDGRISTSMASNRSSNIKKVSKTTKKSTKKVEDKKINVDELDFEHPYFDVVDEEYLDLANYLTFNSMYSFPRTSP